MGLNTAMALADGTMDLTTALHYHLSANHYPPVPDSMIEPCIEAMEAYWQEDFYRPIDLNGNLYKGGSTTAPAHAIVEAHHLEVFLQDNDDYEEFED